MLTKRIIPCLDIKDGMTVKGVNFIGLRNAGDPVELAERYTREGADELVFLDISATAERRKTFVPLVERIARKINIPFTVGGGIKSVQDADKVIQAGADKVSINSAAVQRPELINELALKFGTQAVVVAIDAKLVKAEWKVFLVGGTVETELNLFDWAVECQQRGAGEILFTSMSNDGTKAGFANNTLKELTARLTIPVIASGGAGSIEDFVTVFKEGEADAALAASVFHFGEISIPKLKNELKERKIEVRL